MLKNTILLFILVLGFVSCSDSDDTIDTNINFALEYDGSPFVFFNDYTYPDGKVFNLTRLSFYISDIEVSDGTTSELKEQVTYVDLTNSHSSASGAVAGYDLEVKDVGLTDFTSLNFNIGLNAAQNATNPNDYTSDNDLSRSAEYWTGWNSYIFAKIEGNIDLDGDMVKETGVALHLGSDETLRIINLTNISSNEEIRLKIDVKNIFQNGTEIFDIETTSRIHSLAQIDQANELMDNLKAAVRLEN